MKKIDNYAWVDDHGNTWSLQQYTERDAEAAASTLVGCERCHNCINCVDCQNCSNCCDCTGCTECINCKTCHNCCRCYRLTMCDDCCSCQDAVGVIPKISVFRRALMAVAALKDKLERRK